MACRISTMLKACALHVPLGAVPTLGDMPSLLGDPTGLTPTRCPWLGLREGRDTPRALPLPPLVPFPLPTREWEGLIRIAGEEPSSPGHSGTQVRDTRQGRVGRAGWMWPDHVGAWGGPSSNNALKLPPQYTKPARKCVRICRLPAPQ